MFDYNTKAPRWTLIRWQKLKHWMLIQNLDAAIQYIQLSSHQPKMIEGDRHTHLKAPGRAEKQRRNQSWLRRSRSIIYRYSLVLPYLKNQSSILWPIDTSMQSKEIQAQYRCVFSTDDHEKLGRNRWLVEPRVGFFHMSWDVMKEWCEHLCTSRRHIAASLSCCANLVCHVQWTEKWRRNSLKQFSRCR